MQAAPCILYSVGTDRDCCFLQRHLRSCLKFLAILKRLNFQGAVSGFCLPIGCYFGAFLRFSRPIAWLSSFEKRGKIPRNFLPMPQTNKFKQLLKNEFRVASTSLRTLSWRVTYPSMLPVKTAVLCLVSAALNSFFRCRRLCLFRRYKVCKGSHLNKRCRKRIRLFVHGFNRKVKNL